MPRLPDLYAGFLLGAIAGAVAMYLEMSSRFASVAAVAAGG